MDEIKVDRQKLLLTLQENKAKHLAEHEVALTNWRAKVLKALSDERDLLMRNSTVQPHMSLLNDYPKPQSYEKDYDEAINLLTWSVEDEVVLNFHQAKQWAQGEWGWTSHTQMINASYSRG